MRTACRSRTGGQPDSNCLPLIPGRNCSQPGRPGHDARPRRVERVVALAPPTGTSTDLRGPSSDDEAAQESVELDVTGRYRMIRRARWQTPPKPATGPTGFPVRDSACPNGPLPAVFSRRLNADWNTFTNRSEADLTSSARARCAAAATPVQSSGSDHKRTYNPLHWPTRSRSFSRFHLDRVSAMSW